MGESETKTRSLKIYYAHHGNSYERHPVIRLAGKYLAEMDFQIGDRIEVTMQKNEICIRKVLPSEADSGTAEAQLDRNTLA